jgi:hypothetical protein
MAVLNDPHPAAFTFNANSFDKRYNIQLSNGGNGYVHVTRGSGNTV